jgi:hypothetical protein
MTRKSATVTGKIMLEVEVDGASAADVLAIEQWLVAAAGRRKGAHDAQATTTFHAPGLMSLPLGSTMVSGRRRSQLAEAGIVDPETFFAATAHRIRSVLSWGALKEIRYGLFRAGKGEHLKGDDPNRFPHLVDSLSISNELYHWLRENEIATIAELLARRDEQAVAKRFSNLDGLLKVHARSYGPIEFT